MLSLREELESIRAKLETLQLDYTALSVKYGYEVSVNCELIDLCRAHGIKYRSGLDISKWPK